jgi:hypothetical protein
VPSNTVLLNRLVIPQMFEWSADKVLHRYDCELRRGARSRTGASRAILQRSKVAAAIRNVRKVGWSQRIDATLCLLKVKMEVL